MSARLFGHYFAPEGLELFAIELLGLGLSLAAVSLAVRAELPAGPWLVGATVALVLEGALYLGDLHDPGAAERDRSGGRRLLGALGAAAVVLGAASWIWPARLPPRVVLTAAAAAALCTALARWAYLALLHRPLRVLLLGQGPRAAAVERAIGRDAARRFQLAGRLNEAELEAEDPRRPGWLAEVVRRSRARIVVVASEERRGLPLVPLLACRLRGLAIVDDCTFVERLERRVPVDLARPGELAFADVPVASFVGAASKRVFDVVSASVLLCVAAPVMAAVAVLVRASSRGPVFYRQERLGRDGRPYTLVKFRTMRLDAEAGTGPVWAQERDPRVTPVGTLLRRARLDELPQLFNVLAGEMSLVGPRPERPFFAGQLRERIPLFDLRLAAKPGVTGWAQLRYPYGASVEDARAKLELDLYYLKNWSPFLDVLIAFHTAKHVLLGRGAR